MPLFSPAIGGIGMPIGRGSGVGVNSSVRLPYERGAFGKALTLGGGAASASAGASGCVEGVPAAAMGLEGIVGFVSRRVRAVALNVRHWHKAQDAEVADFELEKNGDGDVHSAPIAFRRERAATLIRWVAIWDRWTGMGAV
jgi:hypothetical protein